EGHVETQDRVAADVARVAGCAVGRAVVAFLTALDDPVAAALDLTGRRAAVAGDGVPVVALFAGLLHAVAAHRRGRARDQRRGEAAGGGRAILRGPDERRAEEFGWLRRIAILEAVFAARPRA